MIPEIDEPRHLCQDQSSRARFRSRGTAATYLPTPMVPTLPVCVRTGSAAQIPVRPRGSPWRRITVTVCAAVVDVLVTCNQLPVKYFGKSLTIFASLRKGRIRPWQEPRPRKESAPERGCIKEYGFHPGGPPNPRTHTQRLRDRNPSVGSWNPSPARTSQPRGFYLLTNIT